MSKNTLEDFIEETNESLASRRSPLDATFFEIKDGKLIYTDILPPDSFSPSMTEKAIQNQLDNLGIVCRASNTNAIDVSLSENGKSPEFLPHTDLSRYQLPKDLSGYSALQIKIPIENIDIEATLAKDKARLLSNADFRFGRATPEIIRAVDELVEADESPQKIAAKIAKLINDVKDQLPDTQQAGFLAALQKELQPRQLRDDRNKDSKTSIG